MLGRDKHILCLPRLLNVEVVYFHHSLLSFSNRLMIVLSDIGDFISVFKAINAINKEQVILNLLFKQVSR